MRVLIFEDEPLAAQKLVGLIQSINPDIEILNVIDTVTDAIAFLNNEAMPDLIISDIHLADGLCFSIFSEVQHTCPIIFATAYDKYAIQAFEVNSVDYLLKPIQEERLQQALDKYSSFKNTDTGQSSIFDNLKELLAKEQHNYKTRFLCKVGNKIKSIPTTSISYFYSQDKMTFIRTQTGQNIPLNNTLDEIDQMVNPEDFFRLNRKFISHYESIHEIHTYFKGRVKIKLNPSIDEDIVVSTDRTPIFKSWLDK